MKFDLAVTVRDKTGKGAARQLRREGKIPGVLYGQGECLLLTIEPDSLVKILKAQAGGAALVSLTLTGAKSKPSRTAFCEISRSIRSKGMCCMRICLKSRWTSRFA